MEILDISRTKSRRLSVNITVGSLDKDDVYNAFYDESKRRLFRIIPEGADYSMQLVEDINARKQLLRDRGILTNPYNFDDV